MRPRIAAATVLALIAAGPAAAGQPQERFEPRAFRSALRGEPSRIFVLGTPHLSEQGAEFQTAWLDPLLDRLQAFTPAAIAIEALSGESLHQLGAYESVYPEMAETFGGTALALARAAQASIGLDMPAAEAAARRTLAAWPASPSPAQRRRLAAMFLASGDPNSALVQWLRLPAAERRPGDGITAELAERLERRAASRNESVSVAVRLAVRLGLERVHAIDDQSEADLILSVIDDYAAAERSPATAEARSRYPLMRFTPITSPESALRHYRQHNEGVAGERDAAHQWRSRLDVESDQDMHRRRIAAWETRNLRMAAHVRELSGLHPGRPILVLVGSAHKPYLEAYLSRMSDADIVPAGEVLGR